MTETIKKRQENPTLPLARAVAVARLKRAGFTTSFVTDWLTPEQLEETKKFPESLIRKLAGYDD